MGIRENFAHRLKHLREIAGLTQTQLAKKLDISRGSISYYENCERIPDIEFLDKVSIFFNVDINYLLGYSNSAIKEYSDASEQTGLSDLAIDILFNAFFDIEPLSKMIEEETFEEFMILFGYYCDSYKNIIDDNRIPTNSNQEYLAFLLSKILIELISTVARKIAYKNFTSKDFEKSEKEFNKKNKEYEEFLNKMKEKTDMDLQDYLIKNEESIEIRKKIHESFNTKKENSFKPIKRGDPNVNNNET